MKITVIPAAKLSDEHVSAWSQLQRSNANLANPFFRPEFTQAVAAERNDVEVAVWEQSGEPVGFLPFERGRGNVGRPVGNSINMYQGAVTRSDVDWSPQEIVRAAGLRAWRFDHWLAEQGIFTQFQYVVAESPYFDLAQGFEHYRKSRGKSAATFVSHIMQKDRKAGRDLGEVRLETNVANSATLARLLEWKRDQCRVKRSSCVYELNWAIRLQERLLNSASEDFASLLFSLYIGGRLVSAFHCLRSRRRLQGCVLGYDRNLGPYAPGLVLLMRVAQTANSLGVTRIDMGSGGNYKDKLASGCDRVAEGAVPCQTILSPIHRGLYRAKDRLRGTSLRGPVRFMRHLVFMTRLRLGLSE
jgi:CelD/BcsL family acetyltransferase involved in cellulose biosynthesis